jgi:DNA-binding response OmpR family regulator/putative methionine-R-sulfoxide reductase with GAF domain
LADVRILVVDDERFFREAIRDALTPAGYAVEGVATGAEALEQLAEPSIGVLVLDLVLPDLHGLEVFRRAKALRPELRVVILSAHTEQRHVLEALRLGACDYLAKPLHEEELVLAVRRAVASYGHEMGWKGLRERMGRLEGALARLSALAAEPVAASPEALRADVVATVAEVLGVAKTSLLLLDEGPGELRVAATHGRKIPEDGHDPVQLGEGVAGVALARAEPILVADVANDGRFPDRRGERGYSSGSFAVAPLVPVANGQPIGVLCATDRRDGPMDEDDLALLRILAQHVARLLDAQTRAREPETLAQLEEASALEAIPGGDARGAELVRSICDAVTAEVEPGRILTAALERVGRLLRAAPVSIHLAAGRELVREAQWDGGACSDRARLPLGVGLAGAVFEGAGLVASDAPARDPRFAPAVDTADDGTVRPLLCGPIRFRTRTLGVFRAFPAAGADAAPALAELLSAALSAAVRNVLLYRSLVQTIEEVALARKESRPPTAK